MMEGASMSRGGNASQMKSDGLLNNIINEEANTEIQDAQKKRNIKSLRWDISDFTFGFGSISERTTNKVGRRTNEESWECVPALDMNLLSIEEAEECYENSATDNIHRPSDCEPFDSLSNKSVEHISNKDADGMNNPYSGHMNMYSYPSASTDAGLESFDTQSRTMSVTTSNVPSLQLRCRRNDTKHIRGEQSDANGEHEYKDCNTLYHQGRGCETGTSIFNDAAVYSPNNSTIRASVGPPGLLMNASTVHGKSVCDSECKIGMTMNAMNNKLMNPTLTESTAKAVPLQHQPFNYTDSKAEVQATPTVGMGISERIFKSAGKKCRGLHNLSRGFPGEIDESELANQQKQVSHQIRIIAERIHAARGGEVQLSCLLKDIQSFLIKERNLHNNLNITHTVASDTANKYNILNNNTTCISHENASVNPKANGISSSSACVMLNDLLDAQQLLKNQQDHLQMALHRLHHSNQFLTDTKYNASLLNKSAHAIDVNIKGGSTNKNERVDDHGLIQKLLRNLYQMQSQSHQNMVQNQQLRHELSRMHREVEQINQKIGPSCSNFTVDNELRNDIQHSLVDTSNLDPPNTDGKNVFFRSAFEQLFEELKKINDRMNLFESLAAATTREDESVKSKQSTSENMSVRSSSKTSSPFLQSMMTTSPTDLRAMLVLDYDAMPRVLVQQTSMFQPYIQIRKSSQPGLHIYTRLDLELEDCFDRTRDAQNVHTETITEEEPSDYSAAEDEGLINPFTRQRQPTIFIHLDVDGKLSQFLPHSEACKIDDGVWRPYICIDTTSLWWPVVQATSIQKQGTINETSDDKNSVLGYGIKLLGPLKPIIIDRQS